MAPGLCSMIKIEDVSEPCTEAPHRVAEALLLFCQVVFLIFLIINYFMIQQFSSGYWPATFSKKKGLKAGQYGQ